MQPGSISAFEHQVIPIGIGKGAVALTALEASRLAQLSERRPGFCTLGYQSVRLAQYVGLVGMGDRVLEILPKVEEANGIPEIGRGMLLRLLRLSGSMKIFVDGHVHHNLRKQSLLDVFISAFFDEVSSLVRSGLLRRYQTVEEDLPLIRGRLLIGHQASAHAMRVDRLACQFDDLTADNIWNRCLKTALYAVKNLSSSFELGRRWLELSAALAEVSLIHLTTKDLEALVFDRQARPYKAAIQWAKWILMVVSPNLRSGANEAPGLVFDMNKLFESSVATMLRRKASGKAGFRIDVQETGAFLTTLKGADGKQAFGLRPDLVVRAAGKVVGVGDTKWSRMKVSPSGYLMPEGAHIYQMQAYASIFPCEHFTLIYPWHSGLEGSKATAFQLPAIGTRRPVINIVCVDVGCDGLRPLTMATGCVIDNLLR